MNKVSHVAVASETAADKKTNCSGMASPPDTSVSSTSFCEERPAVDATNELFTAEIQEPHIDNSDTEVTSSSEIKAVITASCIPLPLESHADEVFNNHILVNAVIVVITQIFKTYIVHFLLRLIYIQIKCISFSMITEFAYV